MSDRSYSYSMRNIGPPYPAGLKAEQRDRNLMVVFEFDEHGVLKAYWFRTMSSP